MTRSRAGLAAAVRPFAPRGRLTARHMPAFNALADLLGLAADPREPGVPPPASPAPRGHSGMTPGPDCIKLVQQFEGCARRRPDGSFAAYPDPATGGDPWTIGWGSTGADVRKGVVWTQQQCDDRFIVHLNQFAASVAKLIGTAPTTQHQFDAMVSFAYNLGAGNLGSSTLLKKHKARDFQGAAAEFAKWNKANKKVMAGLTRRRAAEAAMYGRT